MKAFYLFAAAAVVFAQPPVRVVKKSAPQKALSFEVTVPATRTAVWQAFTTSQGLSTWLTPGAVVDLRTGGEWTAHFPGGKTGGGSILSFVPEQELVISAMAPERFPTVRAERTRAKFEFIDNGASATVRLVQTGWKDGAEWDAAYDHLAQGNAQMLDTLRRRFVDGPIDWAKEWGVQQSKRQAAVPIFRRGISVELNTSRLRFQNNLHFSLCRESD